MTRLGTRAWAVHLAVLAALLVAGLFVQRVLGQ